jgi:hypothetical protein
MKRAASGDTNRSGAVSFVRGAVHPSAASRSLSLPRCVSSGRSCRRSLPYISFPFHIPINWDVLLAQAAPPVEAEQSRSPRAPSIGFSRGDAEVQTRGAESYESTLRHLQRFLQRVDAHCRKPISSAGMTLMALSSRLVLTAGTNADRWRRS